MKYIFHSTEYSLQFQQRHVTHRAHHYCHWYNTSQTFFSGTLAEYIWKEKIDNFNFRVSVNESFTFTITLSVL